jgi:hypothetical protein
MLNFYSSNYVQVKKPYNQINIDKINKQINNKRERASSINIEKMKTKSKIMPTTNSLNKKSTTLKTISVNKQIQCKKKSPIKNKSNTENNNFFTSCNGISTLKDASYKTNTKLTNNLSINNNLNKNIRIAQTKNGLHNYSNNKLRRKKILSVDINNSKKNNIKNVSQLNINNNLKLITDTHNEHLDINKNNENISNTTYSFNNTSNPTSNGAKTNNIPKNNVNNDTNKSKAISVNHQNQNRTKNNIKSPEKKFSSNIFNTCVGISDKKGRNVKNNIGANKSNNNKKINLQIKQPLKLFEENSSMNLTTSGNYNVNFTNSNNNNNEKKYIKPNLKNSNTFYKINHNNYNNYDTNNYKLLKDVVDIQLEMEKSMKDNPTNSKSKKYNTIKHAFESLLKLLGNTIFKNNNNIINTFLEKILIGYHEVVSAFSLENRKLKQVNYNLNEQYEKMSKDLFNSSKALKEKQKQIENLQKKIYVLQSGKSNAKYIVSPTNKNKDKDKDKYNITVNVNNLPKIKSEQNEKVLKFNERNIEDLDALYFYDKVKMNKKKAVSIPKILIKQQEEQEVEEEEEYEEEDERSKTIRCSSLNDIKFNSPLFIRIRQAFD